VKSRQEKLHLGCGDVNFSGWLNIDLDTSTADMNLDLTQPLPFANGSITHIFNEHFIEHVSRQEAVSFLIECRRVLSGNGVIRITTPNLRFLISSYLACNKDEWGELWQPDTKCALINEGMRSWGHQFIYDADELVRILTEAGFNSILFQGYRRSQDKELCELENRPFHNELIVEARIIDSNAPSVDLQEVIVIENSFPIKFNTALLSRIDTAEKATADQANHIQSLEVEMAARVDHNTDLINHIQNLEVEMAARGDRNTDLTNHIQNLESALLRFQRSIYGRSISALSRFYSLLTGK
jgi:predicted SAM-dependent methyltransferase